MIPLLRTLNAIVAGSEPRRINCSACLDTGDTESGRACNWCALGGVQDDEPLEPSAEEVERLRAIEREFMR